MNFLEILFVIFLISTCNSETKHKTEIHNKISNRVSTLTNTLNIYNDLSMAVENYYLKVCHLDQNTYNTNSQKINVYFKIDTIYHYNSENAFYRFVPQRLIYEDGTEFEADFKIRIYGVITNKSFYIPSFNSESLDTLKRLFKSIDNFEEAEFFAKIIENAYIDLYTNNTYGWTEVVESKVISNKQPYQFRLKVAFYNTVKGIKKKTKTRYYKLTIFKNCETALEQIRK